MQRQLEGETGPNPKDEPIVMRLRGKSWGRLDPKTLRWSMKRGRVEVVFDLRATLRARRPVEVKSP